MNETIKVYLEKIKENVKSLKESLPKTIEAEELKETGTFGHEEKLLSSGSYFFHTSELQNHNKIHELFILHQNTPIRVCIDVDNRLKYKDSHAYIYDCRGNIVQLSSVEKKYYLDCGLITE
jgi:hemerythrin